MQILAASSNRYKIAEIKAVAAAYPIDILAPTDLVSVDPVPRVEETAETYLGNALIKAKAYAAWSGLPALADDSGLEVYALGHRPGVHSARYAGVDTTMREKIAHLLKELAQLEDTSGYIDRRARFVCQLALCFPDEKETLFAEGVLEGSILYETKGTGGFGYDPIVHIQELGRTLAEVDFSLTARQGFRAKALQKLFARLVRSSLSLG